MPELPEVDFARGCLERWLGGRVLARVEADPTRILRGTKASAMEALAGHRLDAVSRTGKCLILRFDGGLGVLGHLGMTGKFVLHHPSAPEVPWSRVRFFRDDGCVVHYQDPRMFGRMVAGSLDRVLADKTYQSLGADAWGEPPTPAKLARLLGSSKRAVKDLLLDQTLIAGIGNIYATEALHHAGVHPARHGTSLKLDECRRLVKAIRWTLGRALKMNSGDSITYVEEGKSDNPFVVYGRAGSPCPQCRTVLRASIIAGRTSVFCPKCQPSR